MGLRMRFAVTVLGGAFLLCGTFFFLTPYLIRDDPFPNPDYVVVLGTQLSLLEQRVQRAVDLSTSASQVVMTGGFGEAELASGIFARKGGRWTVLLEEVSTTTREN